MATPLGHALAGMAVARLTGARSSREMLAAAALAAAPDVDVIAGWLLHRDPWRLHRKWTHRPAVVLGAGALAGVLAARRARTVSAGETLGAVLAGAAVAGSHVVLDRLPLPYRYTRRGAPFGVRVRNEAVNLALDAALYGVMLVASRGRR